MTCRHVLGLIDAGPFADYPAAHLDAAWAHADNCSACGPALRASRVLTSQLRVLAQPSVPSHVATTVMARIARLEAPILDQAARSSTAAVRSTGVGWTVWGAAACLTAGFVVVATLYGSTVTVWPGWTFRPTMQELAASSPAALAAPACGLVVYVIGLLMPLRRNRA
jgi:hypothetical protein